MKEYIPDYYKDFQCIADKCKDSCCIGWEIMIDSKSYKKYQNVKGEFRDRLMKGIDLLHNQPMPEWILRFHHTYHV